MMMTWRSLEVAVAAHRCLSIMRARSSLPARPTTVSFRSPFLNSSSVGMPRMHELARRHRVLVDVHLGDGHAAVVVLGQLVHGRRQTPARRAPLRPEIHQDHAALDRLSKSPSLNVLTLSEAMSLLSSSDAAPSSCRCHGWAPAASAGVPAGRRSLFYTPSRTRAPNGPRRSPASCRSAAAAASSAGSR